MIYSIYVHANFSHETLYSPASAQRSPAPPPDRTTEPRSAPQTDSHLCPSRFWENHTDQRMDCGVCDLPVAWLSLDEGDKVPVRFLVYFVTALQKIAANIGEEVLEALQSPQSPPIELILTTLLNEITAIPNNFILVLDDYHVIDSKPVDDVLTFLLERLPPQMHLVITTRENPNLPPARLRARDQLTELRAADLRFSPLKPQDFLIR